VDKIKDQKGAGGMPVYYGARYQRKMGIGSIFKSLVKLVVSDLDLTASPPTQTSVEDASIVEHNPIHSLTHGGPIEFLSLGSSTH
jgi:hypothetical protein